MPQMYLECHFEGMKCDSSSAIHHDNGGQLERNEQYQIKIRSYIANYHCQKAQRVMYC